MSTSIVENVDETLATWQQAIYRECVKVAAECGAAESRIDGAGADGDELEFTLAEIGQAFNLLRDARDSYKESAESWSTRAAQEDWRAEQAERGRDILSGNLALAEMTIQRLGELVSQLSTERDAARAQVKTLREALGKCVVEFEGVARPGRLNVSKSDAANAKMTIQQARDALRDTEPQP